MNHEEHEALSFIEATYSKLDAWREEMATVTRPEAGSALESDDAGWPSSPLSQLAVGSLGSATDHLDAVRAHVVAKRAFVFATETLLRTALMASAQAVWMLKPEDRATRQSRGRTIALETHSRHRQYIGELLRIDSTHDTTQQVRDHLDLRIGELAVLREELGEKQEWNATSMIEEATKYAFGPEFEVEARSIFRQTSGAAHGLPWSVFGRPATKKVEDEEDGLVSYVAGSSLASIHNAYSLAFHLTNRGWALFRQLNAAA